LEARRWDGDRFFPMTKFVSIDHGSQIAGWIVVIEKASIMKHLPSSSIAFTSSRVYWSFCTRYRVLSACLAAPAVAPKPPEQIYPGDCTALLFRCGR